MIKKLASRVREYKKQAIATPLFMIGEVAMEALIPMIMAWLIDRGIGTDEHPSAAGGCRGFPDFGRACRKDGGGVLRRFCPESAARHVLPHSGFFLCQH